MQYIGRILDARADRDLVKPFDGGQLVKVPQRQPPGGRWTDPNGLPAEQAGCAMRDLDRLAPAAANHGRNVGTYAARLLDGPSPWTRMRAGLSASRPGPATPPARSTAPAALSWI